MKYVSKVLTSKGFMYCPIPEWGTRYFEALGVNMQHTHKYDNNHVEVLFYDNNIDKSLSHEVQSIKDGKPKIEAKDGNDVILTLTDESVQYNTMSSNNKKISYSIKLVKGPYKISIMADSSHTGISTKMSVEQAGNGTIKIILESTGPRGVYKLDTILPVGNDYHEAKDYLEAISERFDDLTYFNCFAAITKVDRGCVDLNRDLDLVTSVIQDPILEEKLERFIKNVPVMEYGYTVRKATNRREKGKITPKEYEHIMTVAKTRKETREKRLEIGETKVKIKVSDKYMKFKIKKEGGN